MHHRIILASGIIFPGAGIRICITFINFRGGNPVHYHFHQVFERHFVTNQTCRFVGGKVDPVFKMVLIPAFMMEPGNRIALFFLLSAALGPDPP